MQFFARGSELIGRGLPLCTQSETIAPYGGGIVSDYARYTAGTAMLETAERFTDHEGEPAVQQYLLLVGALRTLARGEHAPHLILDAFLLRSLAVNGYAPTFTDCAKCGMPGPNRFFSVAAGRLRLRRLPGAGECRTVAADPGTPRRAAYGRLGDRGRERAAARPGGQRAGVRLSALASGARAALTPVRREDLAEKT